MFNYGNLIISFIKILGLKVNIVTGRFSFIKLDIIAKDANVLPVPTDKFNIILCLVDKG